MSNPVSGSVARVIRRYDRLASFYTRVFAPLLIPRRVRRAGITALGLSPGMRVLEIGCGSGLDLPLLVGAVGSSGTVYGVDVSPRMLGQAKDLVSRHNWCNVELREQDAARLTDPTGLEAVLFGFSYAILPDPAAALQAAWQLLRPGGRLVIVEGHVPDHRVGRLLRAPLLLLSKRTVLGDPDNRGWEDLTLLAPSVDTRWLGFGTYYVARVVKLSSIPR
jgi:demethylmenaquinone methyltransferase/2-methoxy-6-polyprenyl-1,4-benzoquinol methylase